MANDDAVSAEEVASVHAWLRPQVEAVFGDVVLFDPIPVEVDDGEEPVLRSCRCVIHDD